MNDIGLKHTDIPAEARPGAVLAGKYRVERLLGRGGMGLVVSARHLQLGEPVAIKFMLPEDRTGEAVNRFMREAWAAAKIKSEYVVRVSDVASLPNGTPFMVMEYLEGEDLAFVLAEEGRMAVEQATEFLLQVCEGVAEAHALGIVHRDLKPSNLFRVRRSDGILVMKVLDFGISKITTNSTHNLAGDVTTSAITMGSPLYMSPEQMNSTRDVDARADLWSLGVIAYEMLVGRPPFVATSLPEIAVKVATQRPAPIREIRPEVPKGLERAVMRCLERVRTQRFGDVAEFAMALTDFAPSRAHAHAERAMRVLQLAAPAPVRSDARAPTRSSVDSKRTRTTLSTSSTTRKRATLGALGGGLAVSVSWFFLHRPPATESTAMRQNAEQLWVRPAHDRPAASAPAHTDLVPAVGQRGIDASVEVPSPLPKSGVPQSVVRLSRSPTTAARPSAVSVPTTGAAKKASSNPALVQKHSAAATPQPSSRATPATTAQQAQPEVGAGQHNTQDYGSIVGDSKLGGRL